jgi:hypothetical protein
MIRKPGVRFNEKARVCFLQPPSRGELKSLWYTRKELKRIRSGIKRDIKSLSLSGNSESSEDVDFQWRGLERVRTGTMCMMLESQQALVRGVLSMQQLHRKLGLRDDKSFTLFVCGFNKEATQRATRRFKSTGKLEKLTPQRLDEST